MSFALGSERLSTRALYKMSQRKPDTVEISKEALTRVAKFRSIVDEKARSGNTYYGINTGFGYLSDVRIEDEKLSDLQVNLVRSHACGVGELIEPRISRGLLYTRLHTFLLGHSGIGSEVIERLAGLIELDMLPAIPCQGSVGASGDLAPLAHLALGLIGEGKFYWRGKVVAAADAFRDAGLKPISLQPKEGLSLCNGTQFMATIGAFAVEEARTLARAADVAAALSLDAMRGTLRAFDERIHALRPQEGQAKVAENISQLYSEPDEIVESHKDCTRVQDPYSFRCTPQVHGASRDGIEYVAGVVDRELNSVTDNPLVFEDGDIISGGNFHGQPVAVAMDFLAILIAEYGSISEQRIMKLTNPQMSGLPAFLIKDSGLNSGYMIPHVVAAALVSENKILSHPASVDSIPTSADKEDHVSMGPIAARKAREIAKNVGKIIAIELLAACQGIDLLSPLKPGKKLGAIYKQVRKMSPYMDVDRSLHEDIEKVADWVINGGIDEVLLNENVVIH